MKRIILVLALTAAPYALAQEVTGLRVLQVPMDELDVAYLAGIYSGILWHNQARGDRGERPFCVSLKTDLPVQEVVDITRRFLAGHPVYTRAPLGLAVEKAFEEAYPCPSRP